MSGPLDFHDDRPDDAPAPQPARDDPPGRAPSPVRPPSTSRYTWWIGGIAIVLVTLVAISSIRSGGAAAPGGPKANTHLPPFAVPLADAPARKDEDAQVDPGKACRVHGPGVLNICDEQRRGPVVFALFPAEADRCRAVLEQFDRLAPRTPGVRFVAVGSHGGRDLLRGAHPYPVGWDRDGGLATTYGLVGCPQITFAHRGGRVMETTRRELTDDELIARVRRLQR